MSVVVICEFNPFHNGHKYIIDKAREYGDVICIMSGAFTQRGEPAIVDKYSRASQAIANGASAVIELPTLYATSSAQFFAYGAAKIISEIDDVTHIVFGAETSDVELLTDVAKQKNKPETISRTKQIMKTGVSYANALCLALGEADNRYSSVLNFPNNLLAVEYLAQLDETAVTPIAVKRTVMHDAETASGKFASASYIRKAITTGDKASLKRFMPAAMLEECNNLPDIKLFENLMLYSLLNKTINELSEIKDIENGLDALIYQSVRNVNSVGELIEKIKSKRYTYARLRRVLLYSLLNINKHIMSDITSIKTRILAIRKEFKPHLSDFNSKSIITRNSMISDDFLDESVKLDMRANDIYSLLCGKKFNNYLSQPMLII